MKGIDAEAALQADLSVQGVAGLSDLSSSEIVELVCKYALWLPVDTYARSPWLAPYAVRRLRHRTDDRAPGPKRDLWGFPDDEGYFADDNSLIKGVVKNFAVNPGDGPYARARISKGLICCHVWPGTTSNPLLFSFVPNLVWLPRSLAGYSDAHMSGPPHDAHEVLKGVSRERFADRPPLVGAERAQRSWAYLPATGGVVGLASYEFDAGDRVVKLATQRIERMVHFLEASLAGGPAPAKRISKRYHAGAGSRIDRTVWPVQRAVSEERRRALLGQMRACLTA